MYASAECTSKGKMLLHPLICVRDKWRNQEQNHPFCEQMCHVASTTPPGDADALALAIQQLATRPALRQRLVSGGLQTASRLTLDRQAERIEYWLTTAVKPPRERR